MCGQRVPVGDEEKTFVFFLKLQPIREGSEKMAEMKAAGSCLLYTSFRSLRKFARPPDVFLQNARVHHHEDSGAPGAFRCLSMNDTFLHPDAASANLNGRLHDFRDEYGSAKYIHDIHRPRNVLQPRVALFAQHFRFVWVHWNDAVPGGLQILGHSKARARAPVRKAHDGNRFAGREDLSDGVGLGDRCV